MFCQITNCFRCNPPNFYSGTHSLATTTLKPKSMPHSCSSCSSSSSSVSHLFNLNYRHCDFEREECAVCALAALVKWISMVPSLSSEREFHYNLFGKSDTDFFWWSEFNGSYARNMVLWNGDNWLPNFLIEVCLRSLELVYGGRALPSTDVRRHCLPRLLSIWRTFKFFYFLIFMYFLFVLLSSEQRWPK